ncbi:unnamed protein product [Paramecium pentaurelia]|uniref:Uncharacterized protein n=1 Tax=Paramecium pentaurelia TaxID=43138 RepID=A0A8S1Y7Q9_9CILI|nr:unnamed protein product [Paramecium pentaurelia]
MKTILSYNHLKSLEEIDQFIQNSFQSEQWISLDC